MKSRARAFLEITRPDAHEGDRHRGIADHVFEAEPGNLLGRRRRHQTTNVKRTMRRHGIQGVSVLRAIKASQTAGYTHPFRVACTAAWTRFRASNFRKISWMCDFTVFSLR